MADIKILADIRIDQCPLWQSSVSVIEKITMATGSKLIDTIVDKLKSFAYFFKILSIHKKYDTIITANIITAQMYGLYRNLINCRYPRHIILELMLDEERPGIIYLLKKHIQKFCFASVDIIFVSSKNEVESYGKRFNLKDNIVRFLPFHTNIIKPKYIERNKGYILSAGVSGRDYSTFVEAITGIDCTFVIVSNPESVKGIKLPSNLLLHCDIPYHKYIELIENCAFVVVPLVNLTRSTGQVVILEAMALGKPVISTRTTGTTEYIEDGVNGLLVQPKDVACMREAIMKLINDAEYSSKLALEALEMVKKRHTFDIYVEQILNAANAEVKIGRNSSGI
jgi:glycosyltransferase involved in cell wall biosynthesis